MRLSVAMHDSYDRSDSFLFSRPATGFSVRTDTVWAGLYRRRKRNALEVDTVKTKAWRSRLAFFRFLSQGHEGWNCRVCMQVFVFISGGAFFLTYQMNFLSDFPWFLFLDWEGESLWPLSAGLEGSWRPEAIISWADQRPCKWPCGLVMRNIHQSG